MKNTQLAGQMALDVPILEVSELEIEPLGDHFTYEVVGDSKTRSGIVLTEGTAQAMLPRVRVLAVGPGRWEHGVFVKTTLKPGDEVLLAHPETGAFHHTLPPVNGRKRGLSAEAYVVAKVRHVDRRQRDE